MNEYIFQAVDNEPIVSVMYQDIDSDFKIDKLDTSYFDMVKGEGTMCPRLKAVWSLLCSNFELYYATREIGGYSEFDFFKMMQSCLNRNADTLERQLQVYDDDIAMPILGRTEKVTYDTHDNRTNTGTTEVTLGSSITRTQYGEEINHHVEVPADVTSDYAQYDRDRSRDRLEFTDRTTTDAGSGTDTTELDLADDRAMTGTVTTELSDLGVRPNYESLNGFLDNNRTFIQEFINVFEECFAPRYRRVIF